MKVDWYLELVSPNKPDWHFHWWHAPGFTETQTQIQTQIQIQIQTQIQIQIQIQTQTRIRKLPAVACAGTTPIHLDGPKLWAQLSSTAKYSSKGIISSSTILTGFKSLVVQQHIGWCPIWSVIWFPRFSRGCPFGQIQLQLLYPIRRGLEGSEIPPQSPQGLVGPTIL